MRSRDKGFLLIVCFFLIFCGSSKKIQFSKKYIPVYNPGGDYFSYDQKFSKSYELYQKRRDTLKKKTILNASEIDKTGSIQLNTQSAGNNKFINDSDVMVNSYGIDLARLKDAKFIEVIDDSSYYKYNRKEKKLSFVALLQKIETEFEEVGHDISLKMKSLHKKKSTNCINQETIVNFNNHDENECDCSVSDHIQEKDGKINDIEVVERDESIKDELIEEEAKME